MLQDLRAARSHQVDILDKCAMLIEDGQLKPLVSAVLPLEQAAETHEMIEQGHVQGKLVLRIQD